MKKIIKKEVKKEKPKVEELKVPNNTKAIKEMKIPDGVSKYKNGYVIILDGKPKEVFIGIDAFTNASKRYKQFYK